MTDAGRGKSDLRMLRERLLTSARADAAPPQALPRTLTALGVGAAATGSVSAVAAATKTLHAVWWKWFVLGSLAGGGVVAGVEMSSPPDPSPLQPRAVVVVAAGSAKPEPALASTPAPVLAGSNSALPVASPLPPVSRLVPVQEAEGETPEPLPEQSRPAVSLNQEIALLDEASKAVREGDPSRGLEVLDRYERECVGAQLGHEATVLRMESLQARGECDKATAVGRRFLELEPGSSQAQRVKTLLGVPCPSAAGLPGK